MDASWEDETARLYAGYTLYHQGGGKEQAVFDEGGQGGVPRSSKLAEKLRAFLPPRGRLLDISCGNFWMTEEQTENLRLSLIF